jgi:hypothetical protein
MMNCDCCCEDRSYCRSCPEKCYPDDVPIETTDDEPVESKALTPLDRFTHGFSQWVSRTKLPDLWTQIAKTFKRVKKK